jgi:hypothetical protein
MSPMSEKELSRQFRVLDQTLSMHTVLKRRYEARALALDLLFLACSVVFCATTFARDDIFTSVGLTPQKVRFVLGLVSVGAFFASLVGLRTDWKGKAAQHRDAIQRLTRTVASFRESREDSGTWPSDLHGDLHRAYWEAMNNVIEVPSAKFVNLKAKHLRKMQLSKMLDSAPGCPAFVLKVILFFRSVMNACRGEALTSKREPTDEKKGEDAMRRRQDSSDLHEVQRDRHQ